MFELQYDGEFIDSELNCKIYDFNPNIVCLEEKFGITEQKSNGDLYQAVARFRDVGVVSLKNQKTLEFCAITDDNTEQICEYSEVTITGKTC